MNVPEGFEPLFRTSPVLDLIGPIYSRGKGSDLMLGLVRASAVFLVSGQQLHETNDA